MSVIHGGRVPPAPTLGRFAGAAVRIVFGALAAAAFGVWPAAAVAGVEAAVSRSDIFVGQPNILPRQSMGLGNGRLGVAIWAAGGLTLQLNRIDTLPGRLSPGRVVLEGLAPMITDRGFRGRLDLFNAEWHQTGAGMTAQVTVDSELDRVIVDVTGADPQVEQKVSLNLWQPRSPTALVTATEMGLAEHWLDNTQPGASGLPFGSLAGIRVVANDVKGEKTDDRTVTTTFHAMPDGHYRVIIASPSFDGRQDPSTLLRKTLDPAVDLNATQHWWHDFWTRVGLIQATSKDGRADYFEALRTLFLFYSAAQSRGFLPGSQAGIGNLFSSVGDAHFWDGAAFWEWNLRMMVAANLSAGVPELNAPYFALYRNNLDAMHAWTRAKMGGREGICVPETMRFNGVGVEYESSGLRPFPIITHSCDQDWPAVANARTLSTGAEVGLWVWETYLKTGDTQFLRANYPLMAESARFLLAYQKPGADGLLHTSPSNAHETQSDVLDPTTDIAAIRALYPATIAAAQTLSRDRDLRSALTAALAKTPTFPLTDAQPAAQTSSADASPVVASADAPSQPSDLMHAPSSAAIGNPTDASLKIIAPSYSPTAPLLNVENIGLEPVWPYSLITPDGPLFQTAVRTYEQRPFHDLATWSYDPVQAARLGMGAEMARSLDSITQAYQIYPNGMADLIGNGGEFYIEQMGVVSVALSEALVQDHADIIRLAPALPPDWTVQGTAYVRGNARIALTAIEGKVTNFALTPASPHTFRIANPWSPGEVITINAKPGHTYTYPTPTTTVPTVSFTPGPPSRPKALGRVAIGIAETCCAPPPAYDPTRDRYPITPESH